MTPWTHGFYPVWEILTLLYFSFSMHLNLWRTSYVLIHFWIQKIGKMLPAFKRPVTLLRVSLGKSMNVTCYLNHKIAWIVHFLNLYYKQPCYREVMTINQWAWALSSIQQFRFLLLSPYSLHCYCFCHFSLLIRTF